MQFVRNSLFEFIKNSLILQDPSEALGASFLRNKLAQTIAYVFILSYQSIWASFFNDFLELLGSESSPVNNNHAVDLYLRTLLVIHEEIGDNLIMREPAITKRNNAIKDAIRERDVSQLADSWKTILRHYTSSNESSVQRDIIDGALKVIGGWISWIDITLVVNQEYLSLIFNCLQKENHILTACDTLLEIIAKKMKPVDKMELIRLLGLKDVLAQLLSSDNEEQDERVAKLLNIVGLELIHILDGSTSIASNSVLQQGQAAQAEEMFNGFIPTIIHCLSSENVDTSCQVVPALSDYLSFVRKESKQEKAKVDKTQMEKNAARQVIDFPPDSNFISPQRRAILDSLLPKLILKMKYDEDTPWSGGDDETEREFLEIRNKFKLLQDQIASIEMDLYIDGIVSVVANSFNPASVTSWRDVELGLFELTALSDSLKNGAIAFVKKGETRASRTMSELFFKMIESNVVAMNHPSVQLHYIELVNRHCTLFNSSNQSAMHKVLETFVSPLCVHNSNRTVQTRSWYLLFRFIKSVRTLVGDIAENVFTSIRSLLEIKAEAPQKQDAEEISADAAAQSGSFESQLYLFELCGLLFSSSTSTNKMKLIESLLQPIFADVEQSLQSSNNPLTTVQVHHDLMAIGTFARGYGDYGNSDNSENSIKPLDPPIFQQFKMATQVVIAALEQMGKTEVVRDAARFAFSRLIPVLGLEILPEITRLISCLLDQCKTSELIDFLSFLGQLVHRFRKEAGIFSMFESLISPLFTRILQALNEDGGVAASGSTDAIISKRNMRRAYLQFIFNILNNGMGALLFFNSDVYEGVLQSILSFASDIEFGDDQSTKQAVLNLNKMLQVWGSGQVKEGGYCSGQLVPGFDQFILEHMSHLSFEIPAKQTFVVKNAQMRLLLGDLASLQYSIYDICRENYLRYLVEQYFPRVGLPTEYCTEYAKQLSSGDIKAFKTFFLQFITSITNK